MISDQRKLFVFKGGNPKEYSIEDEGSRGGVGYKVMDMCMQILNNNVDIDEKILSSNSVYGDSRSISAIVSKLRSISSQLIERVNFVEYVSNIIKKSVRKYNNTQYRENVDYTAEISLMIDALAASFAINMCTCASMYNEMPATDSPKVYISNLGKFMINSCQRVSNQMTTSKEDFSFLIRRTGIIGNDEFDDKGIVKGIFAKDLVSCCMDLVYIATVSMYLTRQTTQQVMLRNSKAKFKRRIVEPQAMVGAESTQQMYFNTMYNFLNECMVMIDQEKTFTKKFNTAFNIAQKNADRYERVLYAMVYVSFLEKQGIYIMPRGDDIDVGTYAVRYYFCIISSLEVGSDEVVEPGKIPSVYKLDERRLQRLIRNTCILPTIYSEDAVSLGDELIPVFSVASGTSNICAAISQPCMGGLMISGTYSDVLLRMLMTNTIKKKIDIKMIFSGIEKPWYREDLKMVIVENPVTQFVVSTAMESAKFTDRMNKVLEDVKVKLNTLADNDFSIDSTKEDLKLIVSQRGDTSQLIIQSPAEGPPPEYYVEDGRRRKYRRVIEIDDDEIFQGIEDNYNNEGNDPFEEVMRDTEDMIIREYDINGGNDVFDIDDSELFK